MYLWTRKNWFNFGSHPLLDPDLRILRSILHQWVKAFFHKSAHISVKCDVHEDVPIKFWKSSGPAAWIWTRLFLAEDSVLRVFVVFIFLQLFLTPQLPYNRVFSSLLWPLNFYQQQKHTQNLVILQTLVHKIQKLKSALAPASQVTPPIAS